MGGVNVMDRRNYIELLSDQIRCKKALPLVTRELEVHIEEQKADFMAEGMTEREAEETAVREMGDPVEVGAEMDRIHRPKMNWRIIIGIGLVSLFGAGMLYALDSHIEQKDMLFFYPASHLLYMLLGYMAMIGVCYFDYTRVAYRAKELLAAYMILLIGGMALFGTSINGARVFVSLFGISVNMSQTLFLTIPLYCAVLYKFRGQGYKGLFKGVLWMLPIIAVQIRFRMAELIILIPAFAIILSVAVYRQYFRIPAAKTLAAIWGGTAFFICAGVFMILRFGSDYQIKRLKVMAAPSQYAAEEGYQLYTLKKLLEGSKFIGQGEHFTEFSGSLPDSSSFALSYVMAYFGVFTAVCVISVMVILLFKLTAMTVKQKNRLGLLMGVGCGVTITIQAAWYVLTNLGVVLIGPVYCPFITNGGTGMIVTYVLFGIMLSIYRYQNVAAEEVKRKCQTDKKKVELF